MAYENVVTVNGGAGVVNRTFPIEQSVNSPLLVPVVQLLAPVNQLLSTITTPAGMTMSAVGGAVQLVIPNNMAKGKYTVQVPNGLNQYVTVSFAIETFPDNGVKED